MKFEMENVVLQVDLLRSDRRTKSIAIQLQDGHLIVRCPARATENQVMRALEAKRPWILEAWQRQQANTQNELDWRDRVCFLGQPLRIVYIPNGLRKSNVELRDEVLRVSGSITTPDDAWIKLQVQNWFRTVAKLEIEERVSHWSRVMDCSYGQIRIKELKSRWGSCSQIGNLNFNWRLVCAPPEVIDYVVVHELSHRFEMNHSRRFWRTVEKFLPNFSVLKAWLRVHGADLFF